MIELDSIQLKIGEASREFYFRPQSSDFKVIEQIFHDHDYDVRRLRRYPEIAQFVARSRTNHRKPLIVDAGANIGASSIYFRVKSPDSLVVAIEPDIGNYRLLQENTKGLGIATLHAALASTKKRVHVIDPGEGFWGYQTRPSRRGEPGGIRTTIVNEIYQLHKETHFPYIVKIDIEGDEKALFSANTDWVEKTPLIIIELHDWLLAGQNTAAPFLRCIANLDRDFIYIGENIFSVANNLGELQSNFGGPRFEMKSDRGTRPDTKSKRAIKLKTKAKMIGLEPALKSAAKDVGSDRPLANTPKEFETDICLVRHASGEAHQGSAALHSTAGNGSYKADEGKQDWAPDHQISTAWGEGIFKLPDGADRLGETATASEQLMPLLRDENASLQQRPNNLLTSQSELQRELHVSYPANAELEQELKIGPVSSSSIISSLRERIEGLETEVNALSSQRDELIRSISWKSSAPVRMIGRLLPSVVHLSKRIRRLFWRLASMQLGRDATTLTGSSFILKRMKQVGREFFARGPSQSHFGLLTEKTQSMPVDIVEAFGNLQSKLGRSVVFVAADMPPMFDKFAGGLRLYNLIRIFCEMNWRVVFASQFTREIFTELAGSADDRKRYEQLLFNIGVEKIAYGANAGQRLIRILGNDIRWAFLSFPGVAEQFIPQVRIHAPWATVIYDMVDFHALRMSREARLKADDELQASADRMRAIELANAKTADVTVAVSETERHALLEIDANLVVEVIPPMFDLPTNVRLELDERNGLLYIGGFWHKPNVDAVLWFVQEVWPLILKQRPDMIFRVAGSNPSKEIIALGGQPGIEVLGYIPDLTYLFAQSRMSVAPLRFGAGVKGKVGQSMAYGLPVVATSIGAEGMNLENGKHLLVADSPDEFAAAVVRLAADDDLWRRLQANGRRFVEEFQSMDVVREKLKALVNG